MSRKKVEEQVPATVTTSEHICEEVCSHPKLTQDEVNNVLILIQAGARALSSQQQDLDKAGEILMVAGALSGKFKNAN